MEDKDKKYGEDIYKLNLYKYGLEDLEGKNILALAADELDRLLKALGEDEISLNLPIPCNEENVKELLALSTCRRCGRCCRPNPQNPASPGIEAFEDEIKAMEETSKPVDLGKIEVAGKKKEEGEEGAEEAKPEAGVKKEEKKEEKK